MQRSPSTRRRGRSPIAWDPAKDEAAGEQCKAYGAAGLMRLPTRLHITWQDDTSLKIETDAGTQTRLFQFGPPQGEGGDWQGVSVGDRGTTRGPHSRDAARRAAPGGSLKVVTTRMKAGLPAQERRALRRECGA